MRLIDSIIRLIAQNIYNAKKKIKSKRLSRYTTTQHLLYFLIRTKKFFVRYEMNHEIKRLRRLFFVNNDVKKILRKNFEILVMNCIYKINKYDMSLMIIMSHTAIDTSFYIDFAFLEKKEQKNFEWLLNCLRCLYEYYEFKHADVIVIDRNLTLIIVLRVLYSRAKNLLCLWHVHKNFLKNCKIFFVEKNDWLEFLIVWHRMIYAFIKIDMLKIWRILFNIFNVDYSTNVDYLIDIWLNKYRIKICKCYINKYLHFDICTIFKVKNDHRVLKISLKCFIDDLNIVVSKIFTVLMNCYQNYSTKLDQQKRNTSFSIQHSMYRKLIDRISSHVLRKINKQYQLVKTITFEKSLSFCTHVFIITMSLFDAHIIKIRIEEVDEELKRLHLENVHSHWRFKKSNSELKSDFETFINDFDYVRLLSFEFENVDDDEFESLLDNLSTLTRARCKSI